MLTVNWMGYNLGHGKSMHACMHSVYAPRIGSLLERHMLGLMYLHVRGRKRMDRRHTIVQELVREAGEVAVLACACEYFAKSSSKHNASD